MVFDGDILVLDLMGVLFAPSHIISKGFSKKLDIDYNIIKSAYKRAVVGDAKELNALISVKEQKRLLMDIVKPLFDLSLLLTLGKRIYILSNLPALWGAWLLDKYLADYISGAFISGFMGVKNPRKKHLRALRGLLGRK